VGDAGGGLFGRRRSWHEIRILHDKPRDGAEEMHGVMRDTQPHVKKYRLSGLDGNASIVA